MSDDLFIGVDVGSGSVRSGIFSSTGQLLMVSIKEIETNNPEPDFYEQSSENIWECVTFTIKEIVKKFSADRIKGISFCATCSLVVIGKNNEPVSVSKSGLQKWNIIMWMDHRAGAETELINQTNHEVLKYVGGAISIEMEIPKILWLKNNLRENYEKAAHFFDLSDFLHWKCTDSFKRSICTTVCKWTFVNEKNKSYWDESFFNQIELLDILPKIGTEFSCQGDSDPISENASKILGLGKNTKVGFSMIDAHSGVLGMIGCQISDEKNKISSKLLCRRLGLISGTSSCHMALNQDFKIVRGIWGPYYGVVFQNLYLAEGGQSIAGKLLHHIVNTHPAFPKMCKEVGGDPKLVFKKLDDTLETLRKENTSFHLLTKDIHVWPDFHGNRSPVADSTLRGSITGLKLSEGEEDLALLYLATMQALAYGSRHIKETLESSGYSFDEIVVCGGLSKSNLYISTHADVLGLPVLIPECEEPVMLGAAISAAASVQNSKYCSISDNNYENIDKNEEFLNILSKMAGGASQILPNKSFKEYHDRKYRVFLKLLDDQLSYRKIMNS